MHAKSKELEMYCLLCKEGRNLPIFLVMNIEFMSENLKGNYPYGSSRRRWEGNIEKCYLRLGSIRSWDFF